MDYAKGDIVDVSQVLKVAAGTDVASGGYLRVTSSGLVQVDLDGGGDAWSTLGTVNGTGAVSVRYSAGGVATTLTVNRVVDVTTLSATSSPYDDARKEAVDTNLSASIAQHHAQWEDGFARWAETGWSGHDNLFN